MPRPADERFIGWCTWAALIASMLGALLLGAALSAAGDTGIALALALGLLVLYVSMPLHLVVIVGSIVIGALRGARRMAWVYLYLLLALVGHATVAATLGGFDSLGQDLAQWQRRTTQPAQVALERAMRSRGNVAEVSAALANGADPDVIPPGFPLPHLVQAASRGDVAVARALLRAGADPNRRSPIGVELDGVSLRTPLPLDVAAYSTGDGRLALVRELIAGGAVLDGSLAFLGACRRGDHALLDLARGRALTVDPQGDGCLHQAAAGGHVATVERLLGEGADPNARNASGRRPLDAALLAKHYAAALTLLKAGAKPTFDWARPRMLEIVPGPPARVELREWLLRQGP